MKCLLTFEKYTLIHNVFVVIEYMLTVIVWLYSSDILYWFASRVYVYYVYCNQGRRWKRVRKWESEWKKERKNEGHTHRIHYKLKHLLFGIHNMKIMAKISWCCFICSTVKHWMSQFIGSVHDFSIAHF